jgi:hypothetical protein
MARPPPVVLRQAVHEIIAELAGLIDVETATPAAAQTLSGLSILLSNTPADQTRTLTCTRVFQFGLLDTIGVQAGTAWQTCQIAAAKA